MKRILSLIIISLMMLSCVGFTSASYGPGDIVPNKITALSNSNYEECLRLTDDSRYPKEDLWYERLTDNKARIHKSIYDISSRFTDHLNDHYLHCYYYINLGYESCWFTITDIDWSKGVFIDLNTYGKASKASIEILYYDINGQYKTFYDKT
ncbi:MAG: hypothetical protein LBC39_02415 [Methanobrevibacter sp.]|jgi:hypothetical protein|nr:hypothetical protein [Candidatus Methanovirga aequatorialis]